MDKIKLSFCGREDYKWIESGNNIICGIKCKIKRVDPNLWDYKHKISRFFPRVINNYNNSMFTVYGVAKCHPGDEFDVKIGKRVAESRAKHKAYSIAKRYITALSNKIESDLNEYKNFVKEMNRQEEHEKKHMNYLITGEE